MSSKTGSDQSFTRAAKSLSDIKTRWDGFKDISGCYKLFCPGVKKPIGLVKSNFLGDFDFDKYFNVDKNKKEITLKGADKLGPKDIQMSFNEAIKNVYLGSKPKANEKKTLENFVKQTSMENGKPDFHPVFTSDPKLQGLKVPSQMRGVLGILTAGIHVNTYSTDNEGRVDRIWVSERAGNKSYGSCLDQIIAGGMESLDQCDAWKTMRRETREESHYVSNGKAVSRRENPSKPIGYLEGPSEISFFTLKEDARAGSEQDHIEPGIRFCFDLKIDPKEVPKHSEDDKSSRGFRPYTVEQIKTELLRDMWKPNCGLVMLDFLRRKGLLDADPDAKRVVESLAERRFPEGIFDFPAFNTQGPRSERG